MGLCEKCQKRDSCYVDAMMQAHRQIKERMHSVKKCRSYAKDGEVRHGHWVYNSFYGGFYECSVCGRDVAIRCNRCPACMAIMDEEDSDDKT